MQAGPFGNQTRNQGDETPSKTTSISIASHRSIYTHIQYRVNLVGNRDCPILILGQTC